MNAAGRSDLKARTLERAAEVLGSRSALSRMLGAGDEQLRGWMRGFESVPDAAFLHALDLIVAAQNTYDAGAKRTPQPSPLAPTRRLRVLVVDDNADGADSLAALLKYSGHEVHTAYEGHEALRQARRTHPDVVFLDIGLPGLDGVEVCEALRRERPRGQLMIIALTGHAGASMEGRVRAAGVDHYVIKPVDIAFIQSLMGPIVRR